MPETNTDTHFKFLVLTRDTGERFLILWDNDPRSRAELEQHLIDLYLDPDLDFKLSDATYLLSQVYRLESL